MVINLHAGAFSEKYNEKISDVSSQSQAGYSKILIAPSYSFSPHLQNSLPLAMTGKSGNLHWCQEISSPDRLGEETSELNYI